MDDPIAALQERLRRGEISSEEYLERLAVLVNEPHPEKGAPSEEGPRDQGSSERTKSER